MTIDFPDDSGIHLHNNERRTRAARVDVWVLPTSYEVMQGSRVPGVASLQWCSTKEQPFSQKPRTPTVAPLLQIGLHGVAEADL